MPYCCVPGCNNKSSDLRCADITFHRLPLNNKETLKIWFENLNLKEQTAISDHHRVCSFHFDPKCFRPTPWTSKRCLLPGVVPNKIWERNTVENLEDLIKTCIVRDCKNNCKNSSATLHPFPLDQEILTKWIEAVNQNSSAPVIVTKNLKICELHFTKDDYTSSTDRSIDLKLTAVPSIFENSSENADDISIRTTSSPARNKENLNATDGSYLEEDIDEEYTEYGEINDDEEAYNLEIEAKQSSVFIGDENQQQLNENNLNTSRSSIVSNNRKRGLSDVINKLHQQQQQSVQQPLTPSRPPTNMYHINNLLIPQEQQPPNKKHKVTHEIQMHQKNNIEQYQLYLNNFQMNKSEIDLYRLLEKANLLSYYSIFTEKGGDDINQLCEADETEFKEIIDLVGMSSKPLHVKRLKKTLDEYRFSKIDIINNSLNYILNPNLNVNTNKCSFSSPTTTSSANSTYDVTPLTTLTGGDCGLGSSSSAYSSSKLESSVADSSLSSISILGKQNAIENDNHESQELLVSNLQPNLNTKYNVDECHVAQDDDEDSYISQDDDGESDEQVYQNCQSNMFNSTTESCINNDTSFLKITSSIDQNEKNIKKAKVVELYTKGERCVRKLSQITGVPLTTVYRVIGKLKGINYNIPRGNGAGRKTILDSQDREILVEILSAHPRISRKALGKELEKRTGKSIHNSTLNRELCRLRHHGNSSISNHTATEHVSIKTAAISNLSTNQTQQIMFNNKNNRLGKQVLQDTRSSKSSSPPPIHSNTKVQNSNENESHDKLHRNMQSANPSNLNQSSHMLPPSAAMLAAAAAALAYPQTSGTLTASTSTPANFPHFQLMSQHFNNAAAFAAYPYLSSQANADFSAFNSYNPNFNPNTNTV